MADLVKRLALKMKMYKVEGTPVHHTALCYLYLRKTMNVKMVAGYAISGDKECCRHYWVEDQEGTRYDVAYELGCLYSPELKDLPVEMTDRMMEGYQVIDDDSVNQTLFEMFQSNPKQFWQECPSNVKLFASNHLK